MEKIKIIATFRSFPTCKSKFQKNSKKIEKIERNHYGFIPSQNRWENAEKERKLKLSLRFVHSRRGRENSKKIAKKIQKIEQYHSGFIPSQNMLEKIEKVRR